MKIKHWLLIIFLISFTLRLLLNFSTHLIPGTNGGYYPIQVLSIVENRHLAFDDMPFLFYFNALLIKVISLFISDVSGNTIIFVLKIIDSLSIALLIIPVWSMLRNSTSKLHQISIALFATCSFSVLILTSDLQKNALAILFAFFTVQQMFKYSTSKHYTNIIVFFLFLTLTLLTHFGTFIILLLYFFIAALFYGNRKVLINFALTFVIAQSLISLIDYQRFERLLNVFYVVFEKSALLSGLITPFEILAIAISILFSIFIFINIKKHQSEFSRIEIIALKSSFTILLLLSFPFLDIEYLKRFSLFLIIPQTIALIILFPVISKKSSQTVSFILISFTAISIFINLSHPKPVSISELAYNDLITLQKYLPKDKSKTIIVARHGLEWWTNWSLKVKVAQEKAVNKEFFSKYENVFILVQRNGFIENQKITPFHEPYVNKQDTLIHQSEFFYLFKHTKRL